MICFWRRHDLNVLTAIANGELAVRGSVPPGCPGYYWCEIILTYDGHMKYCTVVWVRRWSCVAKKFRSVLTSDIGAEWHSRCRMATCIEKILSLHEWSAIRCSERVGIRGLIGWDIRQRAVLRVRREDDAKLRQEDCRDFRMKIDKRNSSESDLKPLHTSS